jgi:hypothetical protein
VSLAPGISFVEFGLAPPIDHGTQQIPQTGLAPLVIDLTHIGALEDLGLRMQNAF